MDIKVKIKVERLIITLIIIILSRKVANNDYHVIS